MKNRAAYMTDLDKMEIRDIEMPKAGAKEVLVELEYVGICGSDVHYFHDGRCGDYKVEGDFMLGHECAGTVVELGEGVENLKVGDKVALEPGITCGQCEFCKTGRYNLCPDVQFLATPPVQGCYENYIAFPENMCFKLPENISTKEGALVEPLSVGMHAANQGDVKLCGDPRRRMHRTCDAACVQGPRRHGYHSCGRDPKTSRLCGEARRDPCH